MPDKLHHTRGIVLRTVKYGETSLVVTIFTELFGVQAYLVNGVRTSSKKGGAKASLFQPSGILDLVVYHSELKQLQRIREFKWEHLYNRILTDVSRNAIGLYMIELLTKCLKQPEANPDLFQFTEDVFLQLDQCSDTVAANLALFFSIHLPVFFGLRFHDNHSDSRPFLDLQEGAFVAQSPHHPFYLDERQSFITSQILKVQHPADLEEIKLHGDFRRTLLQMFEKYYALHIQDFGSLKTLKILAEILG